MKIISSQTVPATLSVLFTNSTGISVIIDKMQVRNVDTAVHSISVYLVDNGQDPGPGNLFKQSPLLPAAETDLCREIVGSELGDGDAIWCSADVDDAVTIRASGRSRPA